MGIWSEAAQGVSGLQGETEGKRGNEGSITWLRKGGDKQGEDYCDDEGWNLRYNVVYSSSH